MDYTEELGWILTEAKISGADVTRRTFDEWRQEGLLPKPKQVHLGRGQGSQSFYPTGTLQQVIVCSEMLNKRRSLDRVRWKLWVRGFPVDSRYIEKTFEKARRSLGGAYRFLSANTESDGGWEVAIRELERNADSSQLSPLFSRLKQRLGRDSTEFLQLILGIAIGSFTNYQADQDGKKDRYLISRAFGLIPGKNKKAWANPAFAYDLPTQITENIATNSAKIAEFAEGDNPQRLDLDELKEAARDVYIALRAVEYFENGEKLSQRKLHPIYTLIHLIFDRASVEQLASMVLLWSSMRGSREYLGGAIEVKNALEAKAIRIEDISMN